MIEEKFILRILCKVVVLIEALYLKGLSMGEIGLQDLVVSKDFDIKLTNYDNIKRNGQHQVEATQWINKPPESFQKTTYNANKTDIFHMAVMLFNMITPGLNPFHKNADKDDKTYKYTFLDRADLFKAIIKHEYGFQINISKELFDILCFSLSY